MKQIFNWTIGSFFRTIGRTLALLLIGGIIAYILSSNDVRLRIPFLTIKVKASTFTEQTNHVGDDWLEITNTSDWATDYPYFKKTIGTNNGNLQSFLLTYQTRNSNQGQNYDYVVFKFLATQPKVNSVTDTEINQSCKTWTPSHYTSSGQIDQWTCSSVYSDSSVTGFEETSTLNNLAINVVINYSGTWNNQWSSCSINGNEIFCPTNRRTIKNIEFKVAFNPGYSTTFDLYLLRGYQLHNKLPNTQDIINNQNQNTQAINQTITDSDTTQDSNETANYFWSDNSDSAEGSLQAIISTPLSLINNLTTGSSSPLCFTLNSKQICIPDGSIIWGGPYSTSWRVFDSGFNGRTTFITFFNLVVGGFMFYKMLLSLFRLVDDMLDPVAKGIEVMKL